ncbi:serine/threonine-protein kinase [Streptomyces sp. BI20]|uniref:serine/threonine-protein kinase n=1 Tax=Streptomyces sp. BI20 TaxID=3403460 RepID=UPI003C77BBF3
MGAPGDVIDGRFELLERLGSGGMGTVWRALDRALHRDVALKEVRPPGHAADAGAALERLRPRVLREARAQARVNHPNVVTIHHIVDTGPHPWLVMELLPGGSLHQRLDQGPVRPAEAARIGRQVLAGLSAAHAVGIRHRDVKPANVLFRADGTAVLTDFGIAALRDATSLTATGELIGTPEYLAPERIRGADLPASDLWSLGILLYVCVEGTSPLRRATTLATLAAVLDEPLPPATRAGALAPVLDALLVRDPDARPDAAALDALLAPLAPHLSEGDTPSPTPPPPTALDAGAGAAGRLGPAPRLPAEPAPRTPNPVPGPPTPPPPAPTPTTPRTPTPAAPISHGVEGLATISPYGPPVANPGADTASDRAESRTRPRVSPLAAVTVVLALCLAALATYTILREGGDGDPGAKGPGTGTVTSPAPVGGGAPATTPPTTPAPGTPAPEPAASTPRPTPTPSGPLDEDSGADSGGDSVGDPAPGGGFWMAQLASEPKSAGAANRDAALARIRASVPEAQVLDSSAHASLNPGYWVLYAPGPFADGRAALRFCAERGRTDANSCLGRWLSDSRADYGYQCAPPAANPSGRCRR